MSRNREPVSKTGGQSLPAKGRLLGIDFGTKRVGVAICDLYQKIASPIQILHRQSRKADEHFFRSIAAEYEAVGIVVGLPVHMSGDESQKSGEARKYAAWLSKTTKLAVDFQDERYSSVQAEASMIEMNLNVEQRKARIDMLAAQILLQEYIDARAADSSESPDEAPSGLPNHSETDSPAE